MAAEQFFGLGSVPAARANCRPQDAVPSSVEL